MKLPERLPSYPRPVRYGSSAEVPFWGPAPQQPDLFDGLRKIWRHRRLVVLCTVGVCGASLFVVYQLPTLYTAQAQIQVGVPNVRIFPGDPRFDPRGPDDATVENERLAMQSRDLMQQVADRLDLARNPEFNPPTGQRHSWFRYFDPLLYISEVRRWIGSRDGSSGDVSAAAKAKRAEDELVDRVSGHFNISVLGRSQVLSVKASSASPSLAAAMANTLASVYLAHAKSEKVDESNRIENFLEGRIGQLQQQVEESETAVVNYRKKYGLYQGTSASVSSQQLTQLNRQLIDAQTAKAEADSRLSEALALRRHGLTEDSLPDVLNSPLIQELREQQAAAERRLARLSANYGPRHPKILDARAAIADIGAKIRAEVGRIIGGLRNQARTADARYAALERNFDRLKTQVGGVNEKSIKLEALERDATVNSKLLQAMLNRAKETIGSEEIDEPGARLISPAAPPNSPSYPPKTLIVLLGTLGGLLFGALAALMRDSVDRTFRRADDLEEATGLPVFSMVPALKGSTPPATQVLRAPASTYNEALRKIYVGLQLSVKGDAPKTVLFTSATPSEGKSVMAASLARLLARNGKKVLLIDCDWRSPTLHRLFQCSNRNGLAQLIYGDNIPIRETIFNDPLSGLDVLVSGGWTPQSSEMLMSGRLAAMMRVFAKNYDLVILDSAPVLVSSEVLVLSRLVDKTLFAARWGHTRRECVLDGLRQLIDAQADVAGVIMSRVDAKRYRDFAYGNLNYDYGGASVARVA